MLKDQDFVEDRGEGFEPPGPNYSVKVTEKGETPSPSLAPPAPASPPPEEEQPAREDTRGLIRRRPIVAALAALALAAALGAGWIWWDESAHFETTDDAFIASRAIPLAPKVAGYVEDVPVTDNEKVAKGALIARIDDRDYRAALDQAKAQVAAAQANVGDIDAQIEVQQAQIAASVAQVEQAKATLEFAKQQSARYAQLAKKGAGTEQNAQQYVSQAAQADAAVKSAQANVDVARRQVDALKAKRRSAQASLAEARAQEDQARLNLAYTRVTAAEPGRVVNLTAEPGEFAAAGTNLTMFVPDDIWVTANFKENQLDAMRPGQKVTLSVDAYPDRELTGRVDSIQPGSGTAFSLLPSQNATGNYVKIVQRVPVKIVLDHPPDDLVLGPGMSVVPSVRVDPSPSLYERLTAALRQWWAHPS